MPRPITEDIRVTVRLDGEILQAGTTLGLFLIDNFLSESELSGLRESLRRGQAFEGGGGAAPIWSVELA